MDQSTRLGYAGLGTSVVFGLLGFVVKIVPPWIAWVGLSIGAALIFVAVFPNCLIFIRRMIQTAAEYRLRLPIEKRSMRPSEEGFRRRIHVQRVIANFSEWDGGNRFQVTIFFLNSNLGSLVLNDVHGRLRFESPLVENLPPITLIHPFSNQQKTVPPLAEAAVTIEQRVPDEMAQEISGVLAAGKELTLSFRELSIEWRDEHRGARGNAVLWDGVSCGYPRYPAVTGRSVFLTSGVPRTARSPKGG